MIHGDHRRILLERWLAGELRGARFTLTPASEDASFRRYFRVFCPGASYVVMSGAGLPCVLRATAQLVYVRLHGPDPSTLYTGSYSTDDLHWWADRIRDWDRQGRDVLAYFNNDGAGHAVRNARTLRAVLGDAGIR